MILTGHVSVTESCCFIHVWNLAFEWQTAGMQNQLEKEKRSVGVCSCICFVFKGWLPEGKVDLINCG